MTKKKKQAHLQALPKGNNLQQRTHTPTASVNSRFTEIIKIVAPLINPDNYPIIDAINRAASDQEAAPAATQSVVRGQIDKLGGEVNERINKLGEDLSPLRTDLKNDVRGCSGRIERQEAKLECFKHQRKPNLKKWKSKPFAVPGLARVASAPNIGILTEQNDPTSFDSTIVRLNSAGIVGRI